MLYYMIMAGGIGSRMNSPELPKQYLKIDDEPIIVKTIRNFEDFGSFTAGVVCCPIDWIEYTKAMLLEYGISSDSISVISGGKNRNCSVKNGCRFLSENYNITENDVILTHDAVRPFINSRIIKENVSAVNEFGAANTVMPVYDSIIRSTDSEYLNECVKRDDIYRVQTPQSFRLKELEFVINSLTDEELESYTDVASIFHNKGYNVRLVKGSDNNIKITTPFDLAVAQAIIANSN
ncbi:MAG: 2-C-methyl-D-erythritol 4-phosphate cytidylyltransferase [Ruminococcaceae bacterium]|nr:2-C-methyl-D-erythritol 4-phosphate cytidylyltransferase [Oscillospiraceae bacterium]